MNSSCIVGFTVQKKYLKKRNSLSCSLALPLFFLLFSKKKMVAATGKKIFKKKK